MKNLLSTVPDAHDYLSLVDRVNLGLLPDELTLEAFVALYTKQDMHRPGNWGLFHGVHKALMEAALSGSLASRRGEDGKHYVTRENIRRYFEEIGEKLPRFWFDPAYKMGKLSSEADPSSDDASDDPRRTSVNAAALKKQLTSHEKVVEMLLADAGWKATAEEVRKLKTSAEAKGVRDMPDDRTVLKVIEAALDRMRK